MPAYVLSYVSGPRRQCVSRAFAPLIPFSSTSSIVATAAACNRSSKECDNAMQKDAGPLPSGTPAHESPSLLSFSFLPSSPRVPTLMPVRTGISFRNALSRSACSSQLCCRRKRKDTPRGNC